MRLYFPALPELIVRDGVSARKGFELAHQAERGCHAGGFKG